MGDITGPKAVYLGCFSPKIFLARMVDVEQKYFFIKRHSIYTAQWMQKQFSIITTYRPPATTISFCSTTTSSPEKKKTSNNRLGTPLSQGVEKPEGSSALQPTTESDAKTCMKIIVKHQCNIDDMCC